MEITSSIVKFLPGMYILRHPKGGLAPLSVARAPGDVGSAGKMEMLSTERTHGAILRDGSDCIVMHVSTAPVELLVTVYLDKPGDTAPVLRVDQIGLDATPQPAATAPVAAVPAALPAAPAANPRTIKISGQGISLIGHIERSGDIVAGPGQILGDPASSQRLEGFQLMWPDRPDGVDLAYSIAVEGRGAMPIVRSGHFCGTKGEARRITEVTFALIGPHAGQFQLEGSACFSGGFDLAVRSGMALSGPSGMEHLTALSVRAVPTQAGASQSPPNPWSASPQTSVFKADKETADRKPPPDKSSAKSKAVRSTTRAKK